MGWVSPEKQREYYARSRDERLEKAREYRAKNRATIREQKRLYEAQPHRKELKKLKSQRDYLNNKANVVERVAARLAAHRRFIHSVCLAYGCRNPNCGWKLPFEPYQLEFHHIRPDEKESEIGRMASWSLSKLVDEMNKCVVLCRNCHVCVHRGNLQVAEDDLCKVAMPDAAQVYGINEDMVDEHV